MKATKKVVSKAMKPVKKAVRRRPSFLDPPHMKAKNWRIIDKAVKEVLAERAEKIAREREAKAK